jgi:RNA polymerase sigma factor (sigma-70 family)
VYNRAAFSAFGSRLIGAGKGVPGTTESGFLAGIQQGETESEAALYEKYSARVYYLALRESRSPQDAEDVRAETFLRVLQAIRNQQVRSAEALPAFILGVTRNVIRELNARRRRLGDAVPAEEAELVTPSHERFFIDREVQASIRRTIERLKPREQQVLRMLFYEELGTEQVAREVAIAPERVRLVKSRALKHFREIHHRLTTASRKRV